MAMSLIAVGMLALDAAGGGWLWLLWSERQSRVVASHEGRSTAPNQRPGCESPATLLQQRAR